MFYIHPTEKWIEEVIRLMNEKHLGPEGSRFMIAFFSSLDTPYVNYFKRNRAAISSFSGRNVHIFTPLIYEGNTIPDDDWRHMRNEFRAIGIPVQSDPAFIFFSLVGGGVSKINGWKSFSYRPELIAGFESRSFKGFPTKLKYAIDACIEIEEPYFVAEKLLEIFKSEPLVWYGQTAPELEGTIGRALPQSTVFISHSSKDRQFVRKLIQTLSADNSMRFWIDTEEIYAGDDIQKTITHTLRASDTDYLLLVVSKHSAESSWVNFELAQFIGFAAGKNIIPILLDKGQRFPEPLDNVLRRLRYVDFSDEATWQESLSVLKSALKRKVS